MKAISYLFIVLVAIPLFCLELRGQDPLKRVLLHKTREY